MLWWVSVAEYTSRMDTEPLGALGMDLDHTYDAVKIRVNVHTAHFTHTGWILIRDRSELDVETWAMRIAHGDLSKNTTFQSCIYHLPPERTMHISESQPSCKNQLWEVV